MASFPDLRPHRRSAKAECTAASETRGRLLLAVSTALLFTAFLAVSELATLRGAKAHDASAFLTRELGPPLDSGSLVRTPAQGVHIRVRHGGFDYRTPAGAVSLVSQDSGKGAWRRFEHGALRDISIGQEAVAVHGTSVEQSLRIVAHHGRRTWRWQLDSSLEPRLANGYVSFFAGRRLVDLEIPPVKILDDEGRDVTPKGAHWSLRRESGKAWLELSLNDAKLSLPYTIDPAVIRTAGTVATGNPTFNVTIPAGVQTGDLLVIVLAQAINTIPATPTGWSLVPNSGGVVAGGGTKIGYATFYRKGLAADSNTTVGMTTTAAGVAEVFVYRGVDTTLTTSCPSATCMIRQAAAAPTGANGTTLTFPTITTAMASEEVVGTGTALIDPAWPATSTTGSYARQSPQHANNGATISLNLYDQNVATSGTAVAGTITIASAKNLGFTFGLTNDTNPPTSGAEAVGGISPAGVAYQPSAGGTIYYNGNGSGQFTISDPITDAESGPRSVTYPAVATSGWTHALETVSTGSSYTSSAYQWAAGTHTAPSAAERTLNEKDNGDNATTSNVVAIVDDSTAPAGGALTVNGTAASGGGSSSYDTDGSFTIGTRTDYTETQSATASGLASATLVRTSASYSSADVCGSFGSPSTITGNPSESGLATGCYKYTLTGTDNVGNTVSIATTVKVDTSDPSAPTFSFASVSGGAYYPGSGTRVYFKPDAASGTFDITASSSDSDTGIASYTFPAGSALGTNWSGSGSGATRTYSYTATATTNGSQNVTAANNAGRSASSSFDVTLDSTAPAGGALTVNGTAASGGGSSSYDTDGSFTIGTRTDYTETQSATASGLASSTLVRTSASYSSADVCGSFGSPSTITGNPSESGLSTGCYKYTLSGTDNVGNTVSISTTVKVDTSDPAAPTLTPSNTTGGAYYPGSGTRVYFKPDAATGGFDISASSSDSDTGIASYGFPAGSALGTNWSGSGSGSSRSYSYTATATSNGSQNVSATNNAGRSASSSFDVTLDSTAPAGGALTVNGTAASGAGSSSYDTDGSFTIGTRTDYSETQSATASGLASSTLVRTTATFSSADTCGSFGSPSTITGNPSESGLSTGCYKYTLTGTDNVGNTVSISTIVKVDTSDPAAPTLTPSNATGGAYYPGSGTRVYFKPDAATGGFDIAASSSDSDTGIASYTFPAGSALGTNWSGSGSGATRTYSFTATATTNGSQNVTATNNASRTNSSSFDLAADSTAPAGGALTVNGTAASGAGSSSYDTDGSFTIGTRTDYTETQSATASGLASSTLVRTSSSYTSPDVCGSFGSPSTITGNPSESGLSTGCYKYTLSGTDNVGNTVSISTTVKVDTSAPSNPSLSISNATGGTHYSGAGTQIFFKPSAANGGFDLTASSSDSDTGISGYTFPTAGSMGANWSVSGSGATRTYSFTPTAAEPGSKSVSAANNAGSSGSSNFTVTADSTSPTTTVQCNGAACLNGTYYTSAPVSVTLSGNDGSGSGVQTIRYTTDGSDPTPLNGSDYSGPINVNSTETVKYRAYDNLGNEEAVGSQDILLDGTPPNLSLALTENPSSGAQHVSGTTLFYKPGGGGTFRVTATADDPHTGLTSVDFPSIANVTGGGSQTSSPYIEDYTWSAATTDASAHDVVATNGASATTNVPFTLTQDSAAPTGQSITLTGANAPYYSSASVSFSLGDGNDGSGSGLDTSSRTVTRESATLTGDSCGTFSADAGTYSSPDTGVSNAHCYRYTFTVADNVGNVSSSVTATAKVDTQAPAVSLTAPDELTGAGNQYYDAATKTHFFRPTGSGSFRLNATASDTETAVASVGFPDISGLSGWSGSTGGNDTTSPYSSPADYTWSSGAAEPGAQPLSGLDKAANNNSDTITLAADSAAPTGQSLTLTGANAPYYGSASVTFSLADGNDGSGSGLDLSTRSVTRETGDLVAGACSNFTADAGSFASPDSAVSTGHCYRYTFTIADRVGNVSSSVTATAKVDTDAPSVSATAPTELTGAGNQYYDAGSQTQFFRPAGSGSFTLHATATDGQSNVSQVAFPNIGSVSGWAGSIGGADGSSPYASPNDYSWGAGASAPGARSITATNGAAIDGVATITLSADSTAPTGQSITLTGANVPYYNAASVTFSLGDGSDPAGGAGLDTSTRSVSRETGDLVAGNCSNFSPDAGSFVSPDTAVSTGHCYRYSFTIADNVGNVSSSVSATAKVDLTAPNTTIDSNPTDPSGNTTPSFSFSSTETGSSFECRIDSGSWSSCTSPNTISPALAEGSHTFQVRATDQAGNTDATPASYMWVIDSGAPTVSITAPTAYVNSSDPNNYTVTASTPDSDVTRVDFFECTDASTACTTGSWVQFGTDSTAPYAATWSTPAFDGPKAIRAVAVDAADNTGQHIRTITIDRTAPTNVTVSYPAGYVVGAYSITTDNGPDSDVNAASGSLERQTGDLANDSCSSYGGWVAATSPDTLASAKCAKYRYSVADTAGNIALATSSNETKSDTAAPTSSLTDPGADLRQTITLSASAGDTDGSGVNAVAFQRRPAGGGSWTTIAADGSSPYSVSVDTTSVADGLYDFRTVATDKAGNEEASPTVVASRRVDNTAPSATMLSPGNPIGGTVTLTSNTNDTGGSGIATVAYELAPNGGSFNSQSASWDTTLVSDGLYDLRVVATDIAGNSTTSSGVTTRVDNTAPALTFSSPAGGTIVSGTVNLVGSASDASPASPAITFAYKLAADPPTAYTATGASWNTATLPAGDGIYDLRARATDDANNTASVENISIRVDNAPPTISITAPAAAINGSLPSPTTFAANASDPAGSGVTQVQFFECSDQSNDCATGVWNPLGTVPAPGPYSVSWSIPAADGNHALAAVATDNAGHPATAIRNVDVDRTAPSTTILTKPSDPSNLAVPSFTFDSSEPGSTFECSIDGGSFAPCTSPHNVPGLTDNDHTFDVRATDAAGNTDATPATWTWHRDTSDPSGTLSNPGANIRQTVTLTSSEADPPANGYASGLQSVTYEYSADGTTWALIGTLNSAPFDTILWNTTGVSDGVYQLHIVVRDVAGNTTTSAAVSNVRIDNTVPTTSQNDPGQYLRGTKTLTGSAADSGSGIDHVDFQRAPTGSGSWTTIATDATPADGFQAAFDTTTVADGHYDFQTVAYDVAGNQAAATPVTDRLVDNTVPTATINSPGPYLRGAVSLTSSTGDPGGSNASGVVTVAYEYSTNGGGSWQSTGASFNSAAVADGNVDLRVVATDAAGNTTTSAAVTSLADNTKPATTDNAPSGWQSSPVNVTLTANDGGSGVNVTEYSVDGNPGYTVGTSVVIAAPADGSNDGAHTIAYFSADNAGNIETIKSTTVLIDATPPACPSCSAADYLRGTVTLSADPDSGGSGIKSVDFEYTDAGGSTWTTIGTDLTGPGPYTADWDTTPVADGHYDLRIQITDNADNVTTTNLPDKVVDNTAPDVAVVGAPTEGQLVSGTIGIAASASDATSPVASVKFYVSGSLLGTDATAPFSLNWNTTTGADGGATIQIVVEDMAGNTTTSPVRNVSVDNVDPTPTLADPGQFLSGTVALSASSDPDTTQVDFERRPAGGGSWVTIASDTTTPWGTSLDTTALADGLYDFRVIATDATGHTGTSPIRANVRVDNTTPAGSLTTPANGATVGGTSVALSGSYSDAGSGVASVRYELRPTGGGSWTTIATATGAPFSASWDATTVSSGSYDLQPVITDRAGNTSTGPMHTITVDVSAPTVVLTNPGATISGSVTLNATVTGSGATQVAFGATPAGGASWSSLGTDTSSPWSTTFDTTQLPDGVYDLRATVSDNLGNTSADVVASIRIDNTAPRVVSSTPGDGTTVPSASSIGLVTSEAAMPVGVTLDGGATVAPVVNGTSIDYGTGPLGAGAHTLAGELQDSSGKKAPFRVHFTVWTASSSLAPPVDKNTTAGGTTTVESADGLASASMPAGDWSSSTGDWIVLRITPMAAPTGLTNGFGAGPVTLDVTARWALAGTEVHEFSRAINILMRSTQKGLVPATFESGRWRVLARVPTAGTLPTGWEDGFYSDGTGFHVLTKHLSVFGLLRDLEAPNAPQNVRGFVGPTGLTLRWTPGSDNSGTYDFVTVFSDSTDAGHYGVDFTAASIGGWTVGDSRIFRLKETDLAGNESPLTQPLRPVPSLLGKTPDEAAALLTPLGLKLGSITTGGTGPAGTITGPAGLVLVEAGSSIDVTVAPGGGSTRLVLKVTTAPRVKPAVLKKRIAARVSVTRAARVTAELFSPRNMKLYTWRFSLKAGRSIVKLHLPSQVRRTGVYTMRWTARSGREAISRKITVRLVGARNAPAAPVQVLLAGPAAHTISGKFPRRSLVSASAIEPTFDAAASRRSDVRVIVVDVDAFGVSLIRDLHTVFPSTKIVALTSGPRQMLASVKAGAAIALPRSTPASVLTRVITKLLPAPTRTRH